MNNFNFQLCKNLFIKCISNQLSLFSNFIFFYQTARPCIITDLEKDDAEEIQDLMLENMSEEENECSNSLKR